MLSPECFFEVALLNRWWYHKHTTKEEKNEQNEHPIVKYCAWEVLQKALIPDNSYTDALFAHYYYHNNDKMLVTITIIKF